MDSQQRKDGLPKRTYFKSGSYYFVYKNKWTRLSYFKDEAIVMANKQNAVIDGGGKFLDLENYLRSNYRSWKAGAKSKKLMVEVSLDEIISLAHEQKWRCAVTNIKLDILKIDGRRRRPFAPSLDRINSSGGYTKDNVRIVCLATNLALNEWGDEVFWKLAEGYLKSKISGLS